MNSLSSKISVAIITNESNELLIETIRTYADVVDEICIGINGNANREFIRTQTKNISNITLFELEWEGYGLTKNKLQNLCKNDWILSVDADEMASKELQYFLKTFQPKNETTIYQFRLINHLGRKAIRFGAWGNGKKYYSRLFNRKNVAWNSNFVHEELNGRKVIQLERVECEILHFSAETIIEVRKKNELYARLSSDVKYKKGKRANLMKKYTAAIYTFLKEYIFQLGILDGKNGFLLARENAIYSYKKYFYLHQKVKNDFFFK